MTPVQWEGWKEIDQAPPGYETQLLLARLLVDELEDRPAPIAAVGGADIASAESRGAIEISAGIEKQAVCDPDRSLCLRRGKDCSPGELPDARFGGRGASAQD